jgi:hypothetical protein
MTATITRLYNDYASASQVVTQLERAGVPRDDISIVASNADNWYSGDRTGDRDATRRVDRDRDGVAEGAAAGAGICNSRRRRRPARRLRSPRYSRDWPRRREPAGWSRRLRERRPAAPLAG